MNQTWPKQNIRLDDALLEHRTPGTVINVVPGRYFVNSAWKYQKAGGTPANPAAVEPGLADGVTLNVTGSTITLALDAQTTTDGVKRPEKDIPFPHLGAGAKIIGGKWVLEGHPGWNLRGFHALGKVELEDVELIGLRGNRNPAKGPVCESFGFTQIGDGDGTVIRRMKIHLPDTADVDAYVAGIYPGTTHSVGKIGILVDDCEVDLGERGWWAFSGHGNITVTYRNCRGRARHGIYTDTGNMRVVFKNGGGKFRDAVVSCRGSGEDCFREVAIRNSKFEKNERMVEWGYDITKKMTGGVLVEETEFDSEHLVASDAAQGWLIFSRCQNAKWNNTHVTAGSPKPVIFS